MVTCVSQWPEKRTVALLLENNTGNCSSDGGLLNFFFLLSGLEYDTVSDNLFEG